MMLTIVAAVTVSLFVGTAGRVMFSALFVCLFVIEVSPKLLDRFNEVWSKVWSGAQEERISSWYR